MNLTLNRRGFLQHLGLAAAGLGVARLPGTGWAAFSRSGQLPRSAPEAQGVASAGLLEFLETVDRVRLNLHSLMVLRHGQVVAEGWWAPYASGLKHTLYSLSKSFTSTAVGLAVAEGRLRVDDKVVSFFPKAVPATVSDNLAAMRVKDLLMMGAGHAGDSLLDGRFVPPGQDWIATVLGRPVPHVPGTHFAYNNGATFLLSAIVQQLTGQTVHEYLKPRLFQPLGIAGTDWEQNAQGINNGAWGLRVKTEDIAKLGQLYLQKGQWRGQQILYEAWVNEATQAQISNAPAGDPAKAAVSDWAQGYGYQFWRCRHGVYRGDGAFGQFCIVLPAEDAVIAITAETNDLQGVLNAVWQHLLPALRGEGLTRDGQHRRQLQRQLAALTLPIPAGRSS